MTAPTGKITTSRPLKSTLGPKNRLAETIPAHAGKVKLVACFPITSPPQTCSIDRPTMTLFVEGKSPVTGTDVRGAFNYEEESDVIYLQRALEDFILYGDDSKGLVHSIEVGIVDYATITQRLNDGKTERSLIVSQKLLLIWMVIYRALAETTPNHQGQIVIKTEELLARLGQNDPHCSQEELEFAVTRHPNLVLYNGKVLHTIREKNIDASIMRAIELFGYEFALAEAERVSLEAKFAEAEIVLPRPVRPCLFSGDIALLTGTIGNQGVTNHLRKGKQYFKVGYGIFGRSQDWGRWPGLLSKIPKPTMKRGEKFKREPACFNAIWITITQMPIEWLRPVEIHRRMLRMGFLWREREISKNCEQNPTIILAGQFQNRRTRRLITKYSPGDRHLQAWQKATPANP